MWGNQSENSSGQGANFKNWKYTVKGKARNCPLYHIKIYLYMFRFRFLCFKEKKLNEWIVKLYAWQKKKKSSS